MSTSHHGGYREPDRPDQLEIANLVKRFHDQVEGKAKREYQAGRISPDDDGTLAYAVAADPEKKKIVIRFGKPVEWIGFNASDVNQLINILKEKLAEIGEACVINV